MPKKQILIVEDDPDTQVLIKKRLAPLGCDCTSAFTVESALKQIQISVPDLVILDLGLSGASGTAFLQLAKDWLPLGSHIPPVIVLSGHKEKEIVDYALDNGAKGFLAKPVNPERLLSMVTEYLQ